MKVTENSTYRLMQTNLNRITTDLLTLRLQGATGLKLNKPSDDPGAIRPVLTTRTQLQQNERYLETMGQAGDKMAATDSHLAQLENTLVRAKELAINAINGSLSSQDLETIAGQIAELRNQLLDTANAKVDGKYIFAGYEEDTVPFTANPNYQPDLYNPADVSTWPFLYHGDTNPTQLEISPGEYLTANLTGRELFFGIANDIDDADIDATAQAAAGKVDIFAVLTRLEEAVRAGNINDPGGAGGSIQAQLANLDIAADQNRGLRSALGAKAERVETAIGHQEAARIDLQQILSRYQDADMIEVFNAIVQKETAFQAALNISGRVSQISILDYF